MQPPRRYSWKCLCQSKAPNRGGPSPPHLHLRGFRLIVMQLPVQLPDCHAHNYLTVTIIPFLIIWPWQFPISCPLASTINDFLGYIELQRRCALANTVDKWRRWSNTNPHRCRRMAHTLPWPPQSSGRSSSSWCRYHRPAETRPYSETFSQVTSWNGHFLPPKNVCEGVFYAKLCWNDFRTEKVVDKPLTSVYRIRLWTDCLLCVGHFW